MSNKLTQMAREILSIEADLSDRLDYTETPRLTINDFELYTFTQIWESTALGFEGIGRPAMTEARTYVFVPISCNQKCFVYFGGRFAYSANYNEKFREDMQQHRMESVASSLEYRKES